MSSIQLSIGNDYDMPIEDQICLKKLLGRAILLIADEHGYTHQKVIDWLQDDDYSWT